MVGRHARPYRYSGENFAMVFDGKGRNEVLDDLEGLRADIEDFRFAIRSKDAMNPKAQGVAYSSARWSLTVTVGVADRVEEMGWWAGRYGAIARAAGKALERGRKAGGNTVSK